MGAERSTPIPSLFFFVPASALALATRPRFVLGAGGTGPALRAASLAASWRILSVTMIWRKISFMGYINNFNWLRRPKCAFFVWLPRLLSRLLIMFRFSFQQKQEIKHPLLEWQLFNKATFQHPLCNFRPRAGWELNALRTVYPRLQQPYCPPSMLLNNRAQRLWVWNMDQRPLPLLVPAPGTPLRDAGFQESCRRTSQEAFVSLNEAHFHGISCLPYAVTRFFFQKKYITARTSQCRCSIFTCCWYRR